MNLPQMLLGALLGQTATAAVWAGRRYYSRWTQKRRRMKMQVSRDTPANSRWLVNYYEQTKASDSLYDCRFMDFETKIPFITRKEWCVDCREDLGDDCSSRFSFVAGNLDFQIDTAAIETRKRLGQNIWLDSPAVYLDRVEFPSEQASPSFILKPCSYYSILSNIIRLEDETFRNVAAGRVGRAPFREGTLPNATAAIRLLTKPFGLGGAVAVFLKSGSDCKVLIHERSELLATYPGAKAVIPNFGFEPIVDHGLGIHEDIFRYNFLREYAEELFDYEDLVQAAASRQIDPLWFYGHAPEVKHLREAIRNGSCTVSFLGFGFDCLNGVPIVAYSALIESPEVIGDVTKRTRLNWEGSGIRLVSLNHQKHELQNWLRDGSFHPGGAFALARALHRLEGLGIC